MAYTTIDKPSTHFNSGIFDGTGASHAISGLGFQPDLVIGKCREEAFSWGCYDSTRGATKFLDCDTVTAEGTDAEGLKSFDSDGFTLGDSASDPAFNDDDFESYFFALKANAGTTSSNSDGSITSTVQANTAAGFSIVTYTGTSSAGTIGHGLGVAPKMILIKARNNGGQWSVFHGGTELTSDPATDFLRLSSNDLSQDSAEYWNDTMPTSTVFSVGSDVTNGEANYNTWTYVAYCFTPIQGFSHFGTYWGNGNADGPMVYTGFRPRMTICKRTDGNGVWCQQDIERTVRGKDSATGLNGNPVEQKLVIDGGNVEDSGAGDIDFYSTGFKPKLGESDNNGEDEKYIYAAFADHPTVGTNGRIALAR